MEVSRVQLGKFTFNFEKSDISELIQSILSQWTETLRGAGCSLVSEITPGIVGNADSYGLEQVAANLLSNAIEHAPGSSLHVTLMLENQAAILKFRDSGPGIDPSKVGRIFEPCERSTPSTGASGMGLGLSIAKTIIDAHHGAITVQSQLGVGTTFTIRIPLNVKNV